MLTQIDTGATFVWAKNTACIHFPCAKIGYNLRMIVKAHHNGHAPATELDALLAHITAHPDDYERLTALAQIYLDATTSDLEREKIRATTAAIPAVYQAYERLYRSDTHEQDPLRYFVLSLAMIAMTDGQPDRGDARQALNELKRFARRYAIDPLPYLAEVESIAGPGIRPLFQQVRSSRPRRLLPGFAIVLLLPVFLALLVAQLPDHLQTASAALLLLAVPVQLIALVRIWRST